MLCYPGKLAACVSIVVVILCGTQRGDAAAAPTKVTDCQAVEGRLVELYQFEELPCLQPNEDSTCTSPTDCSDESWGRHEFLLVYPRTGEPQEGFRTLYVLKGGPPGWVDTYEAGEAVSWGSVHATGRKYRGFDGHGRADWTRGSISSALYGTADPGEGCTGTEDPPPGPDAFLESILDDERFDGYGLVLANGCSNDAYTGRGQEAEDGRRFGYDSILGTIEFLQDELAVGAIVASGHSSGGFGALAMARYLDPTLVRGVVSISMAAEPRALRQLFAQAKAEGAATRVHLELDGAHQSVWFGCESDWEPDGPEIWDRLGILDWSTSDLLLAGEFEIPIAHVWNHRDLQFCGNAGYSDLFLHGPIASALEAVNPGNRSENFEVFVGETPETMEVCFDAGPPVSGCLDGSELSIPYTPHILLQIQLDDEDADDELRDDLREWIVGL